MLLFSATLSYRVLELAYEHMHNPEKLVAESDHVTADHVHQSVYFPAREEKMPLLLNLLDRLKPTRSIIFVNTKAAAEHITERVRRHGCRVGAVSGDVPQLKRQKLLQRFKAGQLDILVATDVAARGLHIPDVSHVFNAAGYRDLYRSEHSGGAHGPRAVGHAQAACAGSRVRRECGRRQRRVWRCGATAPG